MKELAEKDQSGRPAPPQSRNRKRSRTPRACTSETRRLSKRSSRRSGSPIQQKIELLKKLETPGIPGTQMAAAGNREYKVASGSGDAEATAQGSGENSGARRSVLAVARTRKLDRQATLSPQ